MSSACRSADGGLEVMSQNTDDVLFLTPNHDQDEDESCDPEDQRADSPREASVHNAYAAQAQISLLVDADDLNEDLESVERHDRSADDYVRNEKVDPDDTGAVDEGEPADKADNGDTETRPQVDESVIAEMKYLFKNTRYFLIKSNNFENVALAQKKGVWSTPRVNEIKLNKAYRECANVLLIFSVAESGRFQGYARLSSECSRDEDLQVDWILPPNLSARSLKGVFKIDWITKNDLFFTKCAYILNPWNENKPVKVGRDGQEMEPHAGEMLCRQFDLSDAASQKDNQTSNLAIDVTNHLSSIIAKSKKRHEELVNERERQKSRYSDRDRDRRDRRSEERKERGSKSPENTSKGSPRPDEKGDVDKGSRERRESENGSANKPITTPYSNNSHQQNSNYYPNQGNYQHRNRDYQQSSFSQKRFHYDVNKNRSHFDQQQYMLNRQNYNPNYPNYNYQHNMQHQNFNPNYNHPGGYNQQQAPYNMNQQQQAYYNQSMYPAGMNMNVYQQQMMMQQGVHAQSVYPEKRRDRSSSPNKKQRVSNDFLPVAKDIVLKSTTYEEYLAAASSIIPVQALDKTGSQSSESKSVFDRISQPVDVTQYVNYDALSYQSNQSNAYTQPIQTSSKNSSKYEQDVEEFLRRTAVTSQPVSHSKYREEKKSSSRDKDREHRHHRREHRHGSSSSQEKSSKRRSRERR